MVRNIWPANSTEVYGVVLLELIHAVVWHVPFSFEVLFAAPVEGVEFEGEAAVGFGEGVEDLFCCFGDIDAYAVAGDG
jgi:hypothetical protein